MSKGLIERIRAKKRNATDEEDEAADRIEELERERDSFYMDYRMKCDEGTKALQADNARLRDALCYIHDIRDPLMASRRLQETLSSTPEQSLARSRNQVREECAKLSEKHDSYILASEIRAMKEPE